MGATVMYTRLLGVKDFNKFYELLLKSFAERGFLDTTFDRQQVNIEAKRCIAASDHSVIGLYNDDELIGFVIAMHGQNIYNKDQYLQVDMMHTVTGFRRDAHIQELFNAIRQLAQENNATRIICNDKAISCNNETKSLLYAKNIFFQTDTVWEAEV